MYNWLSSVHPWLKAAAWNEVLIHHQSASGFLLMVGGNVSSYHRDRLVPSFRILTQNILDFFQPWRLRIHLNFISHFYDQWLRNAISQQLPLSCWLAQYSRTSAFILKHIYRTRPSISAEWRHRGLTTPGLSRATLKWSDQRTTGPQFSLSSNWYSLVFCLIQLLLIETATPHSGWAVKLN